MSAEPHPLPLPSGANSLSTRFAAQSFAELDEPSIYADGDDDIEVSALREGLLLNAIGLEDPSRRARAARAARGMLCVLRGRMEDAAGNHEYDPFSVPEVYSGLEEIREALEMMSNKQESPQLADERLMARLSIFGSSECKVAAILLNSGLGTVRPIMRRQHDDGTLIVPAELWPESDVADRLASQLLEANYFGGDKAHATVTIKYVRQTLVGLLFLTVDRATKGNFLHG